ncbi:MAG: hypothetical protein PGN37_06635 [Mycobacterium kyogaense]|uniref:Clp protease N-terminal domain-containing protein n=1 Tax=Mycobacterium kyogaense TaxID=2212479 RepID=UPI002FF81C3E
MQQALSRSSLPPDDIPIADLAWALSRLDAAAELVVNRAHDEAHHRHSDHIGSLHLLLALMTDDDPVVRALRSRGIDGQTISVGAEHALGPRQEPRFVHLMYGPNAKAIIFHAARRAQNSSGADASPLHLWWALSRSPHSRAGALLFSLNQLDYVQRRTQ